MELFAKINKCFQPFNIFEKNYILAPPLGSEYTSDTVYSVVDLFNLFFHDLMICVIE